MKHGLVNSKVSLTDDTFNKINKTDFNSKEFFPDLSENDQIKRALRLSLSNSIESDRNVTIPKLFTLDGQFDADSISDVEFEDSKTSDSEVDSDMINKMKKKCKWFVSENFICFSSSFSWFTSINLHKNS